jgi:low temperature requirement protein LtrA
VASGTVIRLISGTAQTPFDVCDNGASEHTGREGHGRGLSSVNLAWDRGYPCLNGAVTSLLRAPGGRARRVTFMELFFDLVYVFAVTQLSHLLLEHLTWHGAGQTGLLLLAVWWAWVYTAWVTNWFDPDHRAVRLMLIVVMLASLIMSASLPEAFGDRGLAFAAAYVVIQVGRVSWVVAALREHPRLRRNFQRILVWSSASGVLWLAGGFADGTTREALWLAALAVEFASPALNFYVPGLGRSHTADWDISGAHLAERCGLFVIIALGESILVTGATFAGLAYTAATVTALVVAFLGSVALWWIYFDRSAEDGSARTASAEDQGRLGRSAYTYFHLPIVAGVIVAAVGDELTIAHPGGDTSGAVVATVLGGPALFLAGHALYKRAIFGVVSVPRIVAVGVLAVLAPLGSVIPPLALSTLATLVIAAVAVWDVVALRSGRAADEDVSVG